MKLIFLHGMPGVGKLTVAKELARLTHFKLFHNHLAVDLATAVFEFGSDAFVQLRERIWIETFKLAVRADLPGMIFTFAPDRTVTAGFVDQARQIMEAAGAELFFVELICNEEELERRLVDPSREKFGKLNSIAQFRELKNAGAFVTQGIPKESLSIDTTHLTAPETALSIARSLKIETAGIATGVASVHQAYTDWAATYDEDRNLTRDLDRMVTKRLLGSSRCDSVIEIGCGTGKNTVLLAEVAEQVLALDFAESMIAKARVKLRECDNVIFRVADLTEPWPCETESADLVVGNLVLEHIENLSFIFSEAARCLSAGGKFFVCELHPFRQYQGMKARFHRANETKEVAAFVHNVSDFISAAAQSGMVLDSLTEWWHDEDQGKPPRLIALEFKKQSEPRSAATGPIRKKLAIDEE